MNTMAELHNIGMTYVQIGCEAVFGSLLTVKPVDPRLGPGHITDGQVQSNPTTPGAVIPGRGGGGSLAISGK